jgi:ribosome biogenesis ATPase
MLIQLLTLISIGFYVQTLYVGFPGPVDRVDILRAVTRGGTRPSLGADVDLAALGSDPRCEGFSGADMTALVREASMAALRQTFFCRPQH